MATYKKYNEGVTIASNPTFGSFWMFADIDFKKHPAAANDIFHIFKLKDLWIIRESYYRIARGSDLGADWEIGLNGGTEIKDVSTTTTAGDWVAGSYTSAAPYLNGADKYVSVQVTDAAETKGRLQVMIEVIADPTNCEPIDANIDD